MRVLILSKALISAAYREKLTQLARLGVDVVAAMPPAWREGRVIQRLEEGETDGYRLLVVPIRLNGRFHLHHYPSIGALLDKVQPNLLHVDEEPYNLATYLAVLAASRREIPSLFFTWQNLRRRYPPPFSLFERYVYQQVAHAIAGSEEAALVLRSKGFRKGISVVPQFGVDPARFHPAPRDERPFTIGFFNRLIPAKAPLLALDAFELLPPGAQIRYLGDGPLRGTLEREVERRGLADRVTITSRVPSSEMPAAVRSMDAIVLPSLTTPSWKEQFGRILIEGMASGVAVVGSDSGEIPRVVGDAGLIVPEGDVPALACALRRLMEDRDLRAKLARRGRQRVLERFTHARIAEHTLDAYREALQLG